jgi:putative RecB family exonuclease
MTIYSHSQLSTYEGCPLKYKLSYRDKIKRDMEGIEAFLGSMVHETLKKCYDDAKYTKINPLDDLLGYYESIWDKNWHDSIIITKKDLTKDNYRALGEKMIESYYNRHCPFDSDITMATEMMVNFSLDDARKYNLVGYIDRLSRTKEGIYRIHDYKTSAHLPTQIEADNDRQLGLYQIGVQHKWTDVSNVKLVWHYLAFDKDLISSRSQEQLSKLKQDNMELIDEIEATEDFLPKESALCNWCEYPDLCPRRKHFVFVESLPVNEYLKEPGVVLINKYVELRGKASEIDEEVEKVKEAILEYAKKESVDVIRGSARKVTVKFDEKLKFPGKNEKDRKKLDSLIIGTGKWMEVSQLDTTSLTRSIEKGLWDKELIDQVMKFGRIEETSSISLSKLKEGES